MREPTDDLTPAQKQILQDVAENGVHIVHVAPGSGAAGDGPSYAYTIGLWHHFEQPEVITFGLPEEVATELLEALTDEVDEGKYFRHGEKHTGLLVNYPVRFLTVPKDEYASRLELAQWAYEGAGFECVQLVWPDKNGNWPWAAEVRDGFRESQPILGPRES